MGNRHDIELNSHSIISCACEEADFSDFGDDGLLDRIGAVVNAYGQLGMSPGDQRIAAESILDIVVTRLGMRRDRVEHPEIALENIEAPLVIAGFPRSGTTLLYSLLAADPASRSPHWWDALHPSPPVGLTPDQNRLRRQIAQREVAEYIRRVPIKKAHNFFVLGADMILECYMLWGLDFRSLSPFLYYRIPGHPSLEPGGASLNLGSDMVATYGFERELLQALQWRRPTGHWVLKDPTNQFYLPEMQTVFPDATFIWPHRDPVQMFASAVELTCIMTESVVDQRLDRKEMARSLLPLFQDGLKRVLDHPIVDSDSVVHVSYEEMVHGGEAFTRSLYQKLGRELEPAIVANIDIYRNDPRSRADLYGKFRYSLEDTGMSAGEIREAMKPYIDKFDIPTDHD